MQRVNPGIDDTFGPVEKTLQETSVPAQFEGLGEEAPEQEVTHLPVKQAGLDLPDPNQTAPENWTASCVITGHLVVALRGQVDIRAAYHLAYLREGRKAVRRRIQQRAEEALAATLAGGLVQSAQRLRWATKTGAWMTVQPSILNGTDLGAQEWRDALFLWYVLEPPDLTRYCNGCNAKFTI